MWNARLSSSLFAVKYTLAHLVVGRIMYEDLTDNVRVHTAYNYKDVTIPPHSYADATASACIESTNSLVFLLARPDMHVLLPSGAYFMPYEPTDPFVPLLSRLPSSILPLVPSLCVLAVSWVS